MLLFGLIGVTAQTQGTLDTSFLPDNDGRKGANGAIFKAVEQADGKIVIGGQFSAYNSIEKNRLVRMNADGSMDESFNQVNLTSSGNAAVTALAIQPDGKILVGGGFQVIDFNNNNEVLASGIMRLSPDGTRDVSFLQSVANISCSNAINSISIQPDGKIILAGDITNCFGDTLDNNENIIRLNADGTIDTSFNAVIDETGLPGTAEIYNTIIQPDGKILVSGYFNESNGVSSPYLTRLNADGSNDTTFNIGTGFEDDVEDIALQPDGKILVVGQFDDFNGSGSSKIVRLNADGSLDASFNVGAGPQNTFSPGSFSSADALGVSIQSDGKIIISGGFNAFDNVQVPQVARLNAGGSLDVTFNNSFEGNPLFLTISTPTILSDSGILLTGAFDRLGNYKRDNIFKLDSSGNLDFSFNQNYGPSNGGDVVIINDVQSTGNGYIVVGQFNEYDNALRRNIAKINNDGTVDTNFSTGSIADTNGFDDEVFDVAVQNDGRIVATGDFDEYNGNPSGKIARLNADGSFDNSFNTGSGFNTRPADVKVQPNGKILVAGVFNNYNGTSVDRLVRLNADGALDASFSANISFIPEFIHLDQNNNIFIGGFGELLKLNPDGSVDAAFSFDGDTNFSSFKINDAITTTFDNSIYIAGRFILSSNSEQKVIYKLNPDGSLDNTFDPDSVDFEALTVKVQSDGKILLGGEIENVSNAANTLDRDIRGLIRLNADGTFDDTFNPDQFTNEPEGIDADLNFLGDVRALSLDNDGRLIVGGFFRSYNKAFKNPLIAVEAFNDVQNFINIPDPNFEQALIDEGIDTDGIVNGQMLESDALGVVDLDVNSKNISDLTGIEFFTDLETLSAFNNNLSNIDLSQNSNLDTALLALNNLTSIDLSNNPNLISISLNDNNLSSIDLSNNTALLQVFINNNNLNSIDVSMLSNLENLGLSGNNLTVLDASQNPSLTSLFCNDNQLQSLNVQNGNNTNFTNFQAQNNPNLSCITVDDVNFSNTNWLNASPQFNFDAQSYFSPDCSNLISIPDPNFEQALIDLNIDTDLIINGLTSLNNVNGVTTLDISNKNISDLTGIEFFNNLQFLTADNNSISTLVLDQNTQLITVGLFQNQLSSIVLPNNNVLSSIDLGDNLLTQIDLSNSLNLSSVFVNNNVIDNIDVSMLSNLNILDVSGNNLTQLDLSPNTVLSQIDVSGNDLSTLNVQNGNNTDFTNFQAQNNPNLSCITVDDVNYSNTNWLNASPQFNFDAQSYFSPDCSNLISIPDPNFEQALIDLNIDTDLIINGLTSLNNVNGVTTLDISNKNISDLTGIEFFNNLQFLTADNNLISTLVLDQNTQLITLGLFQNQLSSIVLPNNNVLSSIDLGNNLLTQIDLSNNPNLSSVFVNNNLIDDIDVSMLSNLNILDLSGNNLTQLDLSPNTVLSQINVSSNNLINFNLQNGNNTSISDSDFNATNNSNLTCIEVDDPTYSFNTWFNKDPQTDFSSECEPDNDNCIDAPLLAYNVPTPGTTFSSTPSGLNPGCQQSGITIFDVWYKLDGPASGIISISINGGGLLKVAVYDDCMAALPIACGVDGILVDNLVPGDDYYIQLWVDAGSSGLLPQNDTAFVGDFTIEIVEETMSDTDFEDGLEFSFYPNPAKDHVQLRSSKTIDTYQIFDINGRAILEDTNLNSEEKEINVSVLSSGVYILKVTSEGSSSTQKLIIK